MLPFNITLISIKLVQLTSFHAIPRVRVPFFCLFLLLLLRNPTPSGQTENLKADTERACGDRELAAVRRRSAETAAQTHRGGRTEEDATVSVMHTASLRAPPSRFLTLN